MQIYPEFDEFLYQRFQNSNLASLRFFLVQISLQFDKFFQQHSKNLISLGFDIFTNCYSRWKNTWKFVYIRDTQYRSAFNFTILFKISNSIRIWDFCQNVTLGSKFLKSILMKSMIMNLHIWNFFALSTQCPIGDMYVI